MSARVVNLADRRKADVEHAKRTDWQGPKHAAPPREATLGEKLTLITILAWGGCALSGVIVWQIFEFIKRNHLGVSICAAAIAAVIGVRLAVIRRWS